VDENSFPINGPDPAESI